VTVKVEFPNSKVFTIL